MLLSQTILSERCPTSRHTLGTSLEINRYKLNRCKHPFEENNFVSKILNSCISCILLEFIMVAAFDVEARSLRNASTSSKSLFKRRVKDRDIYRVHKDYARNCICNFEGRRLRINSELMGIKEEIILLVGWFILLSSSQACR